MSSYRRENDECFIIGFLCPLFVMALICVSGLHEVLRLPQPLSLTVCVCNIGMHRYVVGAKIQRMCCVKTWLLYIMGEFEGPSV